MNLPPKPKVVDATADFLWRHDDCKLASSDLVRDIEAWGRACAEAALEAAAKECDKEFAACWSASAMSQAKEAKKCAVAIRSIKIED